MFFPLSFKLNMEAFSTSKSPGIPGMPKVLEDGAPGVMMIAVRPAWVRVRAADGSVIYEAIMNAGDTFKLPATEEPATLRVGESGAVYFAVNGQTYGPAGAKGAVTKNLALSVENLTQTYQVADATRDLGYQPLMIDPIDFNGLYMQRLQQKQQEEAAGAQPGGEA